MSSFVETKKIFPRDDPFPLTFWLKVTYPLLKAASFDTIPTCDGRTDGRTDRQTDRRTDGRTHDDS